MRSFITRTSEYADAQVKDMSADELAKLLNSNPGNGTFTVKDGKVCKVVNGEACEISYNDASQLLKKGPDFCHYDRCRQSAVQG